jgi:Cysteine rich repeat
MLKLRLAVLVVAVGFSGSALAQLTAEKRTACKPEFDAYCAGTVPGGGRIIACLKDHYDQLGIACKKVLDAQTKP